MQSTHFDNADGALRLDALLDPPRLWSRHEVLAQDCVPRAAGVYGWFFQHTPPLVPTDGCIVRHGRTLLYVGIAPKAPPQNGKPASARTLRHRIRNHLQGNAAGSTLRLTLGCLLADELGIALRRVGSGTRRTFAADEGKLSAWMNDNAFVCWIETPNPWTFEEQLIRSVCLPLNLDQNRSHAFHATLSTVRRAAKRRADALPVWIPTTCPTRT